MMQAPPPLAKPEKNPVQTVIRVALFDGWSVTIVAGLSGLLAAAMGDFVGAVVGVAATGAGLIELHGVTRLRRLDARGLQWMVGGQFFLMGSLLAYCAFQLTHPQLASLRRTVGPMFEDQLTAAGMNLDEFLALFYRLVYYSLAAATVAYQGGMVFYYLKQRKVIAQAFDVPPILPASGE